MTSRLADDGTVTTGQAAACDALRVTGFDWNGSLTLANGTTVGLATWTVEILT